MRSVCCALALSVAAACTAQTSAALDAPLVRFADAALLFEQDVYGLAADRFERYLDGGPLPGTADQDDERQRAELNRALAAQRAELPEAQMLLERFVDRYSPQPIALAAIRQVADNAFAAKDYERAAAYYRRLPLAGLPPARADEVRFRLGYTSFATKDFATASRYLGDLRSREGPYREPATYYYALARYYDNDIAGARRSFEALASSERYARVLPGYLAQLYFAEGDYRRVVDYAAPVVEAGAARQLDQIAMLTGRAHFELGEYEAALPYLELGAAGASRLSAADFYQLGYAQYVAGEFGSAAANLRQLAAENSPLGQQALYYLGNAYLQLDNRKDARPAFASVSRMAYDDELRGEAAWNVAKLNYELGYSQEALEALQSVPPSSRHYASAQGLLARVVLSSRDYARALSILDEMAGGLSPDLERARQRVLVLRGLQLFEGGRLDTAAAMLERSLRPAPDAYYEALALYWLGEVRFRKTDLPAARRRLTAFLQKARALNEPLPDDANVGTANYTLGYIRLRQRSYASALGHFQEAVAELRRRIVLGGETPGLVRVLGDAVLRAGDANFKRNDYAAAEKFYDEAVESRYEGYVYALYQRAIISGLRGESTGKIVDLEAIADEYPRSPFADDALLELGTTYQSISQLRRAEATYRRLVEDYPTSELRNEATIQLGLVAYNQGNTESALNYYKQILANEPSAAEARTAQQALQEIYVQDLGRPNDYLAFLETIPGFTLSDAVRDSVNFSAATARYENGDYEGAVRQYTTYLKQYPEGGSATEAYYRRADSYLLLERPAQALADLNHVVDRGPGRYYEDALRKTATVSAELTGDYDAAYRAYAKLLEVQGDNAVAETELAALRAAAKTNNAKAVADLSASLTADPSLSPAQKAVVAFYRGKAAYAAKEYDAALTAFNTVIRDSDAEAAAEARYLVARIYYLRRDLDIAEAIAVRAQRESSAYPYWVARSTLLLVDVFLDREDFLAARAVAEGLVANYDGDAALVEEARRKLAEVDRVAKQRARVRAVDTSVLDLIDLAPEDDPSSGPADIGGAGREPRND